jgi:hypothetical protein
LSVHTEHENFITKLWRLDPTDTPSKVINGSILVSRITANDLPQSEIYFTDLHAALFSRVDQDLGRKLRKVTEAAIKD